MDKKISHRIEKLDSLTANAIAAGEVVERPASVIKELVENSIDAGADKIEIEIQSGGVKLIKLTDNGCGLSSDDLPLAFERHATSKLRNISDLDTITSMGFRGEALASIAAVSKITATSRTELSDKALQLELVGGEIESAQYLGQPEGTCIEVRDLFFNTPARFKFLKSDRAETAYILDIVSKLAFVHPEISFRLLDGSKELLHTPGNNDLRSVIYLIWGKQLAQGMHPIKAEYENIKLSGYLARADLSRHNRSRQLVFVNNRYIQSQVIRQAIEEAGKTWFMKGRHPQLILFINLPGTEVDVNVHPQKTEVRFARERDVFSLIYHALKDRFAQISEIAQAKLINVGKAQFIESPIIKDQSQNKALRPEVADKVREVQSRPADGQADFKALIENNSSQQPSFRPIYDRLEEVEGEPNNLSSQRLVYEDQSRYFTDHRSSYGEATKGLDNETRPEGESQPGTTDLHSTVKADNTGPDKVFDLLEARLVGQVFKTYLIFEAGDKIFLMDQHAAHERILYEEIIAAQAKAREDGRKSQPLLVPLKIELDPAELSLAMEQSDQIEAEGYLFSALGEDCLVLREIPFGMSDRLNPVEAFMIVLEYAKKGGLGQVDVEDELAHDMACKAAVKAHDNLSFDEMKELTSRLARTANPYHCPHGRPIITAISKYDLEKMFKRIV